MDQELWRSCSFDPSFEQLLPYTLHWNGLMEEEDRGPAVNRDGFESFFDQDGRLVDEHGFRKAVFRGGLEKDVRKDAWKFLFGYYPFSSTKRERQALEVEFYYRYQALKKRWKSLLGTWSFEKEEEKKEGSPKHSPPSVSPLNGLAKDGLSMNHYEGDLPYFDQLNDELKSQAKFFEIQAQIFASRQPVEECNVNSLKKNLRIIDKDVPRTDRDLKYFSGPNNPNLEKLRDILVTFAVFHPDVTYAQGMNDILSRFLVVLDNEVEAYWCFTNYLENILNEFLEDGMLKKLHSVKKLLQEMDPLLLHHLKDCDVGDLMFCHRWLLLSFKREFPFEESLQLFEIISSQHLELSSLEAERIRDCERAKDFLRAGGKERVAIGDINTEYTFELFICVAILHHHRTEIMECNDSATVFQFINGLTHKLDVHNVIAQAENLVCEYCKRSVASTPNSFELVE